MFVARTAYFLDFDHTLFNTDEFFHVDVRNSFLRLGVDGNWWELSYEKAWQTGYTLEKHAAEAHLLSGIQMPLEEMKRVLQGSFLDLRRYLFSDVVPFLENAKRKGILLFLLSFGNPEWQRYKVAGSRIDTHFDNMFFVPAEGRKARFVLNHSSNFGRVVVVDNNPIELDLVKDVVPTAETYCISRVPDDMVVPEDEQIRLKFRDARKYVGKVWRHRHIECRGLDGILCS